jgi:LysM repeat protein
MVIFDKIVSIYHLLIMKSYKYRKSENIKRSSIVFKSYTKRIGQASSFIFSKPVFVTATSAFFLLSNYFIVSSFSQVSRAENTTENFRIYSSNSKKKSTGNKVVMYAPNPEVIKSQKFVVYIVKKGDTLTKIAEETKNSLDELLLNNKINDGFRLRIGDPLKVVKE